MTKDEAEVAVDAYDELSQHGEIGALTYALLVDLVRREVQRRGYPSPHPTGRWTPDDYAEAVHELVLQKPDLTLSLLTAADQYALTALTATIVRNFLIDQVKSSEIGKLNGRLATLMNADPRFVDVNGRWAFADGPHTPTTAGASELDASAWTPRGLALAVLPAAGPTPSAARVTLLTVVEAVLTAAGGSVDRMTLARAVARRFALTAPRSTELTDPAPPTDQHQPPAEPSNALLGVLDQDERSAVAALVGSGTTTAVAGALRCGRRRAEAILQRAIAKIRAIVDAEDLDVDEILATLDAFAPPTAQPGPDRSSSTDVNSMSTTDPDRMR